MKIMTSKNRAFEPYSDDCLIGAVPVMEQAEIEPSLSWKGARIPWSMWCEIVALGRKINDAHRCEVQGRLYYNLKRKLWYLSVRQQEGVGLHTKEVGEAPAIPAGYEQVGTVHTHCDAGAFQSGTDSQDELRQSGFHITIGHLHLPEIDLHSRIVLRGYQYASFPLAQLIDTPADVTTRPELDAIVAEWYLKHPDPVDLTGKYDDIIVKPRYTGFNYGESSLPAVYRGKGAYPDTKGDDRKWVQNPFKGRSRPTPTDTNYEPHEIDDPSDFYDVAESLKGHEQDVIDLAESFLGLVEQGYRASEILEMLERESLHHEDFQTGVKPGDSDGGFGG